MSLGLGWNFPTSAFVAGLEGRIGWQFASFFSAYAIVGVNFGLGVSAKVAGTQVNGGVIGFGSYYLGAIGEFMLGDHFYVGGGGLLGGGGYGDAKVGVDTKEGEVRQTLAIIGQSGFMFGLDGRLGFAFGRPKPGPSFRRGGFNIGIDVMTIWRPNTYVATQTADENGNFGIAVNTNETTLSVMPMLTLGYDAR